MPKLARQTLWRSGEVAAAGLAALTAASISATSPALANEWYGGTAIGTFSSEWNCENYLCITASHQIDLSAFVYESSTSFPSFYFFQDHFSTLLYGVGPSSPKGGCVYDRLNFVTHGEPFVFATHPGQVSDPIYVSGYNETDAWYTATYKEGPILDMHLVHHSTLDSRSSLICPIDGASGFQSHVYKW